MEDYEKKYKEAYEKAKELLENAHAFCEYDMEVVPELAVEKAMCKIFPELIDDQDIRKRLRVEWLEQQRKSLNDKWMEWYRKHPDAFCRHFDLCESEFSFSNANSNDQACDDFVEDDGYSDEIYKQGEQIGNPLNRDYYSTEENNPYKDKL